MLKSITKMGLSMLTPEEKKEWLDRIRPDKHTIDKTALTELIHMCFGMPEKQSFSLILGDISDWVLVLAE